VKFNLAHIIPDPKMHGLYGYSEVIEVIAWGLRALGYEATVRLNVLSKQEVNIVFGAHLLPPNVLANLPSNTIIYNLEQIYGRPIETLRRSAIGAAVCNKFQVWDYSTQNISVWEQITPRVPAIHVPIGWAPVLSRIKKPARPDIDVLFYGVPGNERLEVFKNICDTGKSCVFVCGLYGQDRDSLIARSKIVLNINLYAQAKIFEIVRVSFLLANAKAVVADFSEGTHVEEDVLSAVHFSSLDSIAASCVQLLADDKRREQLEQDGLKAIQKRDIRIYLKSALQAQS
jgi:hypothetical protein